MKKAKSVNILSISKVYYVEWTCTCENKNNSVLLSVGHHFEICNKCKEFVDVDVEGDAILLFFSNNKMVLDKSTEKQKELV